MTFALHSWRRARRARRRWRWPRSANRRGPPSAETRPGHRRQRGLREAVILVADDEADGGGRRLLVQRHASSVSSSATISNPGARRRVHRVECGWHLFPRHVAVVPRAVLAAPALAGVALPPRTRGARRRRRRPSARWNRRSRRSDPVEDDGDPPVVRRRHSRCRRFNAVPSSCFIVARFGAAGSHRATRSAAPPNPQPRASGRANPRPGGAGRRSRRSRWGSGGSATT